MFPTQGVLLKCNKSPGQSATLMQRAGNPALFFCRLQGKAGVGWGEEGVWEASEGKKWHFVPTPNSPLPGTGALHSTGSWRGEEGRGFSVPLSPPLHIPLCRWVSLNYAIAPIVPLQCCSCVLNPIHSPMPSSPPPIG